MKDNQTIVSAARWTARAFGAALLPLLLAFAVGDGVVNPLRGSFCENMLGIALGSMMLGQIAAWKWERIGGLLILGGFVLFAAVNHGIPLEIVFVPCFVTSLLYLGCWWRRSKAPAPSLPEESRPVSFIARWGIGLMMVLSFLTFVLCVAGLSISLLWASHQVKSSFGGLAIALVLLQAGVVDLFVASAGCLFAAIGLGMEAFARRRLGRVLALLLALNAATGPMPLLFANVVEYCRRNPRLVRAVNSGDVRWVLSILLEHAIPPKPDQIGEQALRAAVEEGRFDMIEALVTGYAKANKDACCAVTYENALVIAGGINDAKSAEVVRRLLEAGADPNAFSRGSASSAATMAVRHGNRAVLELLLDAGAKIESPLGEAVGSGNVEFVKFLLSHNADRTFKRNPEFGSQLLVAAAFRQSEELTKILLDAGCDPTMKPRGWQPPPLEIAALISPNPGIVRLLLLHGADPNDPRMKANNEGSTLLGCSEQVASRSHDQRIVALLKSHGAK